MWDVHELAAVVPTDVAGYLRASGWERTGAYGRNGVWSRQVDDEPVDVLLPESNEFRDYAALMAELLRTVADVERRGTEDILRELRFPLVDVQYVRTIPDTPSGTTPLVDGANALTGLRDLFLTAATAVALGQATPVLPAGKRPKPARDFVDSVRLGVPTAGSYVFRVETPIDTAAPEPDAIGARPVLLHLYRSVRAAHTAALESAVAGTPRPFERQVTHGVSANLCEALENIGGRSRSPFEFRFAWARQVPTSEDTPDLRFDREHVLALHDAKSHLRGLVGAEAVTVVGRSVRLNYRDEPTGRVVIAGRVEFADRVEDNREVAMRLSRADYDRVVQAHRPENPALVRVSGLVRTTGRQWELVSVDELNIVT